MGARRSTAPPRAEQVQKYLTTITTVILRFKQLESGEVAHPNLPPKDNCLTKRVPTDVLASRSQLGCHDSTNLRWVLEQPRLSTAKQNVKF